MDLFLVEAGTHGFEKGKRLKKIGWRSQDTAELFFADCRIPKDNRLGPKGTGFKNLMINLQQERLICTIGAQTAAEFMLEETIRYCRQREVFGKKLSQLQNTQFVLAEMAAEVLSEMYHYGVRRQSAIADSIARHLTKDYRAAIRDPEVDAIWQYAQEGHNLIGTYLLFQWETVDNRALAPLFGCSAIITWSAAATTPTYNFMEPGNPVFNGLVEPYVSSGYTESQVPGGVWSTGARLVGISIDGYAAILVYDAPTYRAIFITTMPEYTGDVQDERFFYNAIVYQYQARLPLVIK